ncbi:unnamed protein product [Litomosoides sigmodontis]|uniref:Uncharacterized protein n=1 Tax=Litomosoides sigmodontis TaxID=42156 RepID=A0A3P6S5E0_LITSI|nr:unnamed protein product [Litomosoides sigmodontis]
MAASAENVIEGTRHVTKDDLFGLNTTMIIPLNAYILKMIGKSDSMDVNFSSVNPINLLLRLNKTKPEMIYFNLFSEAPAPIWFQTIAGNVRQIRDLQAAREGTENEQKLFNQVKLFNKYSRKESSPEAFSPGIRDSHGLPGYRRDA